MDTVLEVLKQFGANLIPAWNQYPLALAISAFIGALVGLTAGNQFSRAHIKGLEQQLSVRDEKVAAAEYIKEATRKEVTLDFHGQRLNELESQIDEQIEEKAIKRVSAMVEDIQPSILSAFGLGSLQLEVSKTNLHEKIQQSSAEQMNDLIIKAVKSSALTDEYRRAMDQIIRQVSQDAFSDGVLRDYLWQVIQLLDIPLQIKLGLLALADRTWIREQVADLTVQSVDWDRLAIELPDVVIKSFDAENFVSKIRTASKLASSEFLPQHKFPEALENIFRESFDIEQLNRESFGKVLATRDMNFFSESLVTIFRSSIMEAAKRYDALIAQQGVRDSQVSQ